MFKIATWNVNSLRVRLPHVLAWLEKAQPDVLALQETKLQDGDFPVEALTQAGYCVSYAGQKTYNGVALLSRQPAQAVCVDFTENPDPQRRLLAATVGDWRIINAYVPNGATVDSDKYAYKLQWLAQFKAFIAKEREQHARLVVVGDFNIAPHDIDVYDPKAWEGQVLVSQPERDALTEILELGLTDAFRLFHNDAQYSWWDYRGGAFWRNWGMRIDHILISNVAVENCCGCVIDKAPRKQKQPSDHTPVIAEFE